MKKGTDQKSKLVALRRIEGQVRGVQKMIEEQRYCIDILNALRAVRGALKKVEGGIFRDHMRGCVRQAFKMGSVRDREIKLKEIHQLFQGS
ncbi:MAG: metal-sensitive transcriptional regulator [Candidatus Omnitrophica bacterium]|nr:metal-sensitive transcriptional regulator [Candidatus Omnitrophota bacterium]